MVSMHPTSAICRFSLVEHEEPRYSVFTDAEAQSTLVWVTYKHDRSKVVREPWPAANLV